MDFDNLSTPTPTSDDVPSPTAEQIDRLARSTGPASVGAGSVISASARRVLPENGVVLLPEGVSLDAIRVVGRDIVVQLPNGQQIVVVDGAITMPQLVLGSVQVPPANLAALLIGQEPEPAAGPPRSSGGNFADPVGNIGNPINLGDLLPPTELAFPLRQGRELLPNRINNKPTTDIITPNNPAGAKNATATVNEAGLPARGSESAGSNASANSETTAGSIVYDATDGLRSLTINGTAISIIGQTITTPLGVLTITSIAPGTVGYSYTLTDNSLAPNPNDIFQVVVTDRDGDVATARLTIDIVDDVPTARNDTDAVAAGSFAPQTGNVITSVGTTSGAAGADTQGADGAVVSGIRAGTNGNFSSAGATISGQYGTLALLADGSYVYTRSPGTPGGVNDVFSYRLTDGDGDDAVATLTITIADSPAVITFIPTVGDGTRVSEVGLPPRGDEPPGSNAPSNAETTSGTITYEAPDGPATVQINGTTITTPGQTISTPAGTLTITSLSSGSLGYTFVLTDNTTGDNSSVTFTVTVTDVDGDSATAPLTITIADDTPTARDEAAISAEDAPVIISVFENDTPGADGVALPTAITLATAPTQGIAVYNGNGTFTYTPNSGAEGTDSFTYTITDGDGDTSTATVTITLAPDSVPAIRISGDNDVAEAGLPARGGEPAGSDASANSEIAAGNFAISTGTDTIASLVVNGVNVTGGGTVTTSTGTLVITLSGGNYGYSYTLTDNTIGNATTDNFNIVVTDSDGDSAGNTLVIAIIDDAASAIADSDSLAAGAYGPATGNVITDAETDGGRDTQGADGATVTAVVSGSTAGTVGSALSGQYGQLTLNADGGYSYVRNAGTPGGVSDTFTYTITDGDGDISSATLTITIADSPTALRLPVAGEAGTEVSEAGLPARGSETAGSTGDNSETTNGTFSYTAPDGPAQISINGTLITAVGQTIVSALGTMTITSIAPGAIGYSYILADNILDTPPSDDFSIIVTDKDGDSSTGTLSISIADDAPTAVDDADSVTEDAFLIANGNVLTGNGGDDANSTDGNADVQGADGATVMAIAGGTIGQQLVGLYGTLTLNSDGSYSYVLDNSNPIIQGLSAGDVREENFVYTITDGDGEQSSANLRITINGANDGVVIRGLDGEGAEMVFDDDDLPARGGEPAGSDTTPETTDRVGTFTVDAPDGLGTVVITSLNGVMLDTPLVLLSNNIFASGQGISFAYGGISFTDFVPITVDGQYVGATFTYHYTFNDNRADHPLAGEDSLIDSIGVVVTDVDGSNASATIDIQIIDDVPTAAADTGDVTEGATLNVAASGILANDVLGADGAMIAGVRAAGADTTTAVAAGVGDAIAGLFGTLTLAADGSYRYVSNFNSVSPSGATDVFVYTIRDGDGDLSTTTLTINIADSGLAARNDDVVVNEAALATGSDPLSPAETVSGTLADNVANGSGPFSFALVGSATGSNGTLTLNVNGSYTYTLTAPVDGPTADNGANRVNNVETFTYQVTDANGNTAQSTITIDVIDDVPTARIEPPFPIIEDGATVGGNVITGLFPPAADTPGADGATLTSVTIASVVVQIAPTTTTTYTNANGTYTFQANGAWTFDPVPVSNNLVPVDAGFSYVITDGDGDTSSAAQGITVSDGAGPVAGAPILLALDDQNLAGGRTAFLPDFATGTISFTQGSDAISSIAFSTSVSGLGGGLSWVRISDTQIVGSDGATPIVTLVLSVSGTTATITATLNDNYDSHPGLNLDDLVDLGSVGVVATDMDGDTATGTVGLSISDDVPLIVAPPPFGAPLAVDETRLDIDATANFGGLFFTQFHADGPATVNPLIFSLGIGAGSTGLTDTLTGEAVVLSVNAGVVEGRTATTNALVFTISVQPTTGVVTLDQLRAVTHSDAGNPDDIATFSGPFLITMTGTATDADGDTAVATIPIAGAIQFRDDGPSIDVTTVDGDNIVLTTHDALTIGSASDVATSSANFGGAISIATLSYGADGAGTTIVTYALSVQNAGSGLSSNGVSITLAMNGNVVEGKAGAELIFTLSVDASTGTVTLTQFAEIDHALPGAASGYDGQLAILGEGLVTLSATAMITDRDGDSATETVVLDLGGNVRFADDGPTVTAGGEVPFLVVDETTLSTNATEDFSGLFTTDFGADGAGSTSYALGVTAGPSGLVDTLSGETVILSLSGTTVEGRTATGNALVFTLSVNAGTGAVTLDQLRAVSHTPDTGPDQSAFLANADLITLTATSTDGDGDTNSATSNIAGLLAFKDDAPSLTVSDTPTTVVEGETAAGSWSLTPGADGVTSISVTFGTVSGTLGLPAGGDVVLTQPTGTLTVRADGSFSFAAAQGQDNDLNPAASFTLAAVDRDGDPTSDSLTISITDGAAPAVGAGFMLTLDDQTLADGSTPGTTSALNTLNFTAGSDALSSFTFAAGTGALAGGLTWTRVSDTQIDGFDGTIRIVSLTLTAPAFIAPGTTGAVTVTATLINNYDSHPIFTADDLAQLGSINVVAADHDGDSVSQTVTLQVSDDVPTLAVSGPTTIVEGTSTIGGTWTQTIGADQPGAVTKVIVGGTEYDLDASITVTSGATTLGTLTVSAGGTWVFSANSGLDNSLNPSLTFAVRVTDADLDFFSDSQTITITDGAGPGNAGTITLALDDQNLTDGSTPLGPDAAAGTLTFTAGSDAIGTIVFDTDLSLLNASNLTWVRTSDTLITGSDGANPVVTLTLVRSGLSATVTATLVDNYDAHPGVSADDLVSLGSVRVVATDIDGDIATGIVAVTVSDDVPTANDDAAGLIEGGPSFVNFDVDTNDVPGADGTASRVFATLAGAYGNITLNGDGTQTYTLNAAGQLAINALAPGAILTDSFSYTLTDGDNDSDPATLLVTLTGGDDPVTITNLTPEAGGGDVSVDEDDLPNGTDTAKESLTQTGSFTIGAPDGVDDLTVGGVAVIVNGVYQGGSTTTLLGNTLTFTGYDSTNGVVSYSYTLVAAEAHATGAGENDLFENFAVSLTDVDGDSAGDTLSVRIIDDVPTAADDLVTTIEGATGVRSGNVLTNDTIGADMPGTLVSVVGNAVATSGTTITGTYGSLLIAANGSYTYTPNASVPSGSIESFAYIMRDADGDPSPATLEFRFNGDANPPSASNVTATVDDDGLSGGNVLSTTGDLDANLGETPTTNPSEVIYNGNLGFSFGVDGAAVPATDFLFTSAGGTIGTETVTYGWNEGTSTLTAMIATSSDPARLGLTLFSVVVNQTTGTYTLTLARNVLHAAGAAENDASTTINYRVTDSDGTTALGSLAITFDDDAPTATATANAGSIASLDESATTSTAATLGVSNIGNDPHVAGAGSISTATTSSALVAVGGNFGADGAATTTPLVYALSVTNTFSGLSVTDGSAINLVNEGGVIVGRVASGTLIGQAAFAISINASTGIATVEQYLSLRHPINPNPDETISLAAGALGVTVTRSDGDGDSVTSTAADISAQIRFDDDAGTLGTFVGATILNQVGTVPGTFAYATGADGHGSFAVTGPTLTGVTYASTQNANGTLLTATSGTSTVFTLQVNADGTYLFSLITPQAATSQVLSLSALSAGGPGFRELEDDLTTPAINEAGRIEFTSNGTGVNANNNAFGVSNAFIDPGEFFIAEFHSPGALGDNAALSNPEYVSSVSFNIVDLKNGNVTVRWTAFNDLSGTQESGTAVVTATGQFLIDPVALATFNRVSFENFDDPANATDGGRLSISTATLSKTVLPQDVNLLFQITATDGDGDITSTSTLNVFIDTPTPPIALDLNGDGVAFVSQAAGVTFDYAGDGNREATAWISADDGLLAIDRNRDGLVNDGSEIVFGNNGQTDLQGLAAQYDTNRDGQLTAADAAFAQFGVWQDANSNGITEAGEFQTLTDAGIVSIGLVSDGQSYTAADGQVVVAGQSTFTRTDGSTGIVADVAFATGSEAPSVPLLRGANDDERSGVPGAFAAGMTGAVAAAGLIATSALDSAATPPFAPLSDQGTIDLGQIAASAADAGSVKFDHVESLTAEESWNDALIRADGPSDLPAREYGTSQFDGHYGSDSWSQEHASPQLAELLLPTDIAPSVFDQMPALSSLSVLAASLPDIGKVGQIVADSLSSDIAGRPDIDAVLDALVPQQGEVFAAIDQGGIADLIANQAQAMALSTHGLADFGHDLALVQAQLEMAANGHG
jgi:VCBS repeat-containing protein